MRTLACLPLVLAFATTPISAEAKLTRSGGLIGQSVTYDFQGDPFQFWGLALSTTTGPTPLVFFDPNETRVLTVGFELLALWQLGALDGAGQGSITLPIPLDPGLQGVGFYAQMVTLPGATTKVDEISNRTGFVFAAPQTSVTSLAVMPEDLFLHSATTLNNGDVLIAGGTEDFGATFFAIDDYYLFNSQSGELALVPGAKMTETRTQHTATLLADGRVLTLGGAEENFIPRATGEIFDPVTMTAAPIANMPTARAMHTATLLNDGRVFVSGGAFAFDFSNPIASISNILETTVIYDPATNTWTPGPNLPKPRALHSASLLGDGKVLLTGGLDVTTVLFVDIPSITNDARRYDPVTNSILDTASISGSRGLQAQMTLPNGDALVTGGVDGDLLALSFTVLDSCAIYNHLSNTWTTVAPMSDVRGFHSMLELNNDVFVFGGVSAFDIVTFSGPGVSTIETATTSVLSWTTHTSTVLPRSTARSSVIDNGTRILITGSGDTGSGGTIPDFTAEVYNP